MSILSRALCMAGHHSGEWSHPGSRCESVRVCASCGKVDERTHHVWGQFDYVDPGRCEQVRRCERCGSAESRPWHQWGPWVYADEELITAQVHTCRRCHESERTRRFSTL
jgi:hypothetical protein